jgi:hypothetical protein
MPEIMHRGAAEVFLDQESVCEAFKAMKETQRVFNEENLNFAQFHPFRMCFNS